MTSHPLLELPLPCDCVCVCVCDLSSSASHPARRVLASSSIDWYSVHLKPITGVKNLVCAGIVAMAIGLGALATGGGAASIRMVWRPMAAVAGLIWHREMVMDIKDADGDRLAGVRTVAVACGAKRALYLSLLPLAAGAAAAATAAGGGGALAMLAAVPLMLQGAISLSASMRGFSPRALDEAIELAPLWLLCSLVALTV